MGGAGEFCAFRLSLFSEGIQSPHFLLNHLMNSPFLARLRLVALGATLAGSTLPALAQPAVTVLNPVRNTAKAPINTNVVIGFSKNINPATANKIKVFGRQAGGRKVGTYTTVGQTVTFNPDFNFRPGERVMVTVPNTVKGVQGNLAATEYVYQFRAAATGGSGSFSASTITLQGGVNHGSNSYALADVGGDGKPDLLTFDERQGFMVVRKGNGVGGFGVPIGHPISANGRNGAVGDVDGDGDLDVLITHTNPDLLTVLFNDGAGSFNAVASGGISFLTYAAEPELGDIDGDGDLDFIVSDIGGDKIDVFFNNGAGVFTLGQNLVTDAPVSEQLADIDNDGDLDMISAELNSNVIHIRINNGDGLFGAPTIIPAVDVSTLMLADVNNDGNVDIVALLNADDLLAVWSRGKVGRVSVKDTRIFLPFSADVFVARKAVQPLEPFGEGIRQQKRL